MDENSTSELNRALEAMWESLTDEQREKAKECRSMDELLALAGRAGVELPDEMLEAAAGGVRVTAKKCPFSGCTGSLEPIGREEFTPKGSSKRVWAIRYECYKCKANYLFAGGVYYSTNGTPINAGTANGCF